MASARLPLALAITNAPKASDDTVRRPSVDVAVADKPPGRNACTLRAINKTTRKLFIFFFSQKIAKFRLSRGCTGWSFFDLPVCFSDSARSVCSRLALLYFSVRGKRSRKPHQSVIISEEVPSKRKGRLTFLKSSDILDRVCGSSVSDILQRDTFSAPPRCLQ